MGTRGYRVCVLEFESTSELTYQISQVYRYKGIYFGFFTRWDSYPSGLGLEMASEVPNHEAGEEVFLTWVETLRKRFQESLDVWSGEEGSGGIDSEEYMEITRRRPLKDVFIEWVYTIDLDNLIFWINNMPVFDLAKMPQGDEFVNYIGEYQNIFVYGILIQHNPQRIR